MPKIIAPPENKTTEKRPIITTCPYCQYTISCTEDEVDRVSNNGLGIICPNCDEPIVLEDEETEEYVNIIKRKLQQECKVGEYAFTDRGDTMVFGLKMEDEDLIFVVKN